ncbi:unnamed protein product [Didymodactylos carnosus]|uniref:Uncharacterized protein n=1 Tax=Didymodactylos carnosus TaxID=1234261 RepID=A0A815QVS0_9BILA|nr:unnamed protein product [Didymodactylos carnosus]CAF4336350.1 unnamed protein product [Didymodactylos carnosus]
MNLNSIAFQNYRQNYYDMVDKWKADMISRVNSLHMVRRNELDILCIQSQMEFETFKIKQSTILKEQILAKLQDLHKREQVNPRDVEQLKQTLNNVTHGVEQLKQVLIQVQCKTVDEDHLKIKKRAYIDHAVCGRKILLIFTEKNRSNYVLV